MGESLPKALGWAGKPELPHEALTVRSSWRGLLEATASGAPRLGSRCGPGATAGQQSRQSGRRTGHSRAE